MKVSLSPGAIDKVNNGDLNLKPIVQVLEVNPIGSNKDRYSTLLSDGVRAQEAMLASQLNQLVKSGRLVRGAIVQLIDYICNTVQNRRIIIVLNMEIIVSNSEIIGVPKQFTDLDIGPSKRDAHNGRNGSTPVATNTSSLNLANKTSNCSVGQKASPSSDVFGRPAIQPPYQPPPVYSNKGPIAKNEAPPRIIPISSLNPYQGRWAIKARVTAKADIRRYNNAKGDGKVFSFDLLDSDGGEIRVTCFNALVDRFFDQIALGKVYMISKGSLKPAQKNFNHLNNNWEIFLESSSIVEPSMDQDDSIPKQQFSFKLINEIEGMESGSMADVIGVVISVNPSVTILRKNGMETQKRVLNLKDTSGRTVELTLWGSLCNKEGQELHDMLDSGASPVLAIKASRVSDFSGKSLGTISSTQLFINPDIPEARSLRVWFDCEGKRTISQPISQDFVSADWVRKNVSDIKYEQLGFSDKPDWIDVKANVTFIKTDSFCYTACPVIVGDRQCNKKITRSRGGLWHCERCDQDLEDCDYRYLLQIQIQDHTGLTWVTAFQEAGEEIMGFPAKELYFLKYEEGDEQRFGEIIRSVIFSSFLFKLKVKEERYNDEQRVKITVMKVEKQNFPSENKYLIDMIKKLSV
ncbi:hypothetical protein AMTRI_Chr04g180390 [Amborella trichopoda]